MGVNPQATGRIRSDINVTPLVDVCLVLLIIFMVVTPMLQQGVTVQLPSGESVEERAGTREDLVISIRDDGSVFRGTTWIPDGDLSEWLAGEADRDADRIIVLKADARVPHGKVRAVLDQVSTAGFRRLAILTEKQNATASGG